MSPRLRAALPLIVLSLVACMPARTKPSPHGAPVTLYAGTSTLVGELLAVDQDSVWLLARESGAPTAVGRSRIQRAVVHRGAGVGNLAVRGVVFGLVSGLGMYGACASLSSDDRSTGCGGVIVTSTIIAGALGLFAASSMESLRDLELSRVTPESLARFARWPQGRPRMEAPPSLPPDP